MGRSCKEVTMPRAVEKLAWYSIVCVVHFAVVPAVMCYAAIKGLGTEKRLRG